MGKRGPLPKPTQLRIVEGNPANRPLPTHEPEPRKARKPPTPPTYLSRQAKQIYKKTAQILIDCDLLTEADYAPLAQFADEFSQWVDCTKKRNADCEKGELPDEELSARCMELSKACHKWYRVLGLGPAYRVGLVTNFGMANPGTVSDDPIARAVGGG